MTASHNSEFFQAFHAFTNFIVLDALNNLSLLQFTVKGQMKRRRHNKFKWKRGDNQNMDTTPWFTARGQKF